jgi:hypothetical protein
VAPSPRLVATVLVAFGPLLACSSKSSGPKKETILPLLQKEADSLKADGEKVDPVLGVESTWTIEGLDVREQPGNETNPWAGTVRFKILTRTKDFDGSMTTDESKKRFEYVWSNVLGKWVFKYTPTPRPTPRGPSG